MCPPTYFDVTYSINPWMDPSRHVDRVLALRQWWGLVDAYRDTGHRVDLLEPLPGVPDMVFAANGATVVAGALSLPDSPIRSVRQRPRCTRPGISATASSTAAARCRQPLAVNEAEGDFGVLSNRILAGYGFRTTLDAHRELATLTGREVISLQLVDPRLFHLDLALSVLDDVRDHIAYYPEAFSQDSRQLLRELFPDALIADQHDAYAFGLNAVSDGLHVFISFGRAAAARGAGGHWILADFGGPQRADQGRREREVLYSGNPAGTDRNARRRFAER
jgi:N-dimethylarginine dimethylaminohydrolase